MEVLAIGKGRKSAGNGLKAPGKRFYERARSENELEECHDLERLEMACHCLDEIAKDEKIVKKEGRYIEDRFKQKREHPAAKAIRENKIIFCRIIRELGLDLVTPDESRPPRRY
jgi:phage terminase small subunit